MVDLIRTVSRDISPDPSTKDCDCYDFYQEKENQTDDELCQSIESIHEHARKIEAQQAEIEMLNAELDKKVCICVSNMCALRTRTIALSRAFTCQRTSNCTKHLLHRKRLLNSVWKLLN